MSPDKDPAGTPVHNGLSLVCVHSPQRVAFVGLGPTRAGHLLRALARGNLTFDDAVIWPHRAIRSGPEW